MAYTTIDNPELYFQTKLYTGNGGTQTITFDVTDTSMQPDMVWIKDRGDVNWHSITDSNRGHSKVIYPNANNAEGTNPYVNAFNSNGFGIGSSGTDVNGNTNTYVAWCWKESADAGIDLVSYTGSGGTQNISHSLSAKPEMIITKSRSASGNWYVYHGANTSAPETDFLQLQATDATSDNATLWNDTAPTTSVFTVGSAFDNTTTYVAYAFASKQGFSKFGSYVGNGSSSGTYVHLGFKPAWIVVKRTDSANSWMMYDNKRNPINLVDNPLYAEGSDAEGTSSAASFDFLSNGFKCRGTGSAINASGATMIYMCFAEAPFVNSKGVPCNSR